MTLEDELQQRTTKRVARRALNPKRKFNRDYAKDITELSTPSIVWFMLARHRFGLVSTWAVLMTVLSFVQWLIS